MVSFCFGEPSSFGRSPLSADSCSARVQTLPFRHHVRARRKSESPQKLLQRLKACLGPELAKEKFSPRLGPKARPPSFSLASCLHPAPLPRYIRLNVQKACSLPEPPGDRNGLCPAALPTEKRSCLPAVCRRKGSLRDLPSCLRASVSRHLLGQ